jgi:hypothetical protein
MKPTISGPRILPIIIALLFVLSAYPALGNTVEEISYDWCDRTLQGWTKEEPFGGQLKVNPGFGNPRGSMFAIDTAGGGVLYARAPDEVSGDLSLFTGVHWDEYIQPQSFIRQATFIILEDDDGTRYRSEIPRGSEIVIGAWNSRFEPFDDPDAWVLFNGGTSMFEDLIENVAALFISMDASEQNTGGVESWVDNFRMTPLPIPGAVWLLGSGLVGLVAIRRKFRKG